MNNVYKVQGTAITIKMVVDEKTKAETEVRGGAEDVTVNVLAVDEHVAGIYANDYVRVTKDKSLVIHSVQLVISDVLDSNISLVDSEPTVKATVSTQTIASPRPPYNKPAVDDGA